MKQTDQIGTFSGLSHAELVAAYQECRARNAKLEAALEIVLSATCGDVGDDGYAGCIRVENEALDAARAILAEVTP